MFADLGHDVCAPSLAVGLLNAYNLDGDTVTVRFVRGIHNADVIFYKDNRAPRVKINQGYMNTALPQIASLIISADSIARDERTEWSVTQEKLETKKRYTPLDYAGAD